MANSQLGGTGIKRSNAVSLAFSQALLADAGHNRPIIFDAKANHNTYSVANIGFKSPKPNHGRHSNPLRNSKNELPPLGRALKKSPFFMTKTENAYDL